MKLKNKNRYFLLSLGLISLMLLPAPFVSGQTTNKSQKVEAKIGQTKETTRRAQARRTQMALAAKKAREKASQNKKVVVNKPIKNWEGIAQNIKNLLSKSQMEVKIYRDWGTKTPTLVERVQVSKQTTTLQAPTVQATPQKKEADGLLLKPIDAKSLSLTLSPVFLPLVNSFVKDPMGVIEKNAHVVELPFQKTKEASRKLLVQPKAKNLFSRAYVFLDAKDQIVLIKVVSGNIVYTADLGDHLKGKGTKI